jgi:hypothetical protein
MYSSTVIPFSLQCSLIICAYIVICDTEGRSARRHGGENLSIHFLRAFEKDCVSSSIPRLDQCERRWCVESTSEVFLIEDVAFCSQHYWSVYVSSPKCTNSVMAKTASDPFHDLHHNAAPRDSQ